MWIDLDQLRADLFALHSAWQAEKATLDATLEYCSKHKVTPGDNHWQAEHRAKKKFETAALFYDVMMELHNARSAHG